METFLSKLVLHGASFTPVVRDLIKRKGRLQFSLRYSEPLGHFFLNAYRTVANRDCSPFGPILCVPKGLTGQDSNVDTQT